jgi:hypothetical protein
MAADAIEGFVRELVSMDVPVPKSELCASRTGLQSGSTWYERQWSQVARRLNSVTQKLGLVQYSSHGSLLSANRWPLSIGLRRQGAGA